MNLNPFTIEHSAGSRFPPIALRWLLPMSLAAFVLVGCVILSTKWLLNPDELFTWYPVSAPFHRMLASTADTINSSPPFYFVVAWSWATLFGNSVLSLRLLSAVATAAAILTMFAVLRRAYGVLPASAALAVAFFDLELLFQSANARFYGLLLAKVAFGIFLYQRMMMRRRPSTGLLAANAAVHASLVMTHYFGFLYSGAILGGVLLTCLFRRRNPLPAALSIAAGWLVFLPWIPVLKRQIQIGKLGFWIPVPNTADLRSYFAHFLGGDAWLLLSTLLVVATAAILLTARGQRLPGFLSRVLGLRRRETPLLMLVLMLGSVPLANYFISTRPGATSVFIGRYMTPCALGWAIALAHVSNRAFGLVRRVSRRGAARALVVVQVIAVTLLVGRFGWGLMDLVHSQRKQDLPKWLPALVPRSEPVVVENSGDFLTLHFYSPEPQRYLFVTDDDAVSKLSGSSQSRPQVLEALKRQFPEQFKEVVPCADFLAVTNSFWVKFYDLAWWNIRLAHNPDFVSDVAIPALAMVHERRRK